MTLVRPAWIPAKLGFDLTSHFQQLGREYEFDPPPAGPQLEAALADLSTMGLLAFAVGCAEWVVFGLDDGSRPWALEQLESFWSALALEGPLESCDDPVAERPDEQLVWQVIDQVGQAFYIGEHYGPPLKEVAAVRQHVRLTGEGHRAFERWSNEVLERLRARLPAGSPDAPVSRDVLG